ncbi:Rne/Rng family ribonuclease [Herbiconiux moechotypicola]|uniref:S1 motif domain-containing protein n=1 Tax=Herbiconiux moechotypicola TaxID=637393 RepID=A0ABN3DNX1_9MICO|nr:Rne/Rng family ribonuclease [Herbiconiux moechotypicola]MCS5730419.1 Rne/Rng family ribonuclease [Herbiconiux moechotypicola]
MVENNSHNDHEATNTGNAEGAGKRKRSLFGGRRSTKKTEPQPAVTAEAAPAADTAPAAVTAPAADTAPAAEEAVESPAASGNPVAEAPDVAAAADASGHLALDHDEPGLAPFSAAAPWSAPVESAEKKALSTTSLFFQAPDLPDLPELPDLPQRPDRESAAPEEGSVRRRSRRRSGDENRGGEGDPANTVVKVRTPREPELITEPQRVKGSTRLEAKKQRRRDGRDAGRRRAVVTEAEFLARREAVDRVMVVRAKSDRIQIGVLEDGVLVEHYVAKAQDASLIGNVYLGRVQNVLPSMEAAFVDIGRGRNAVLYSGEVDWEAAASNSDQKGSQPRRIELALKSGDTVLVQVTKDPVGHKGARLTSQISLPGRYLVYVPNGSMNGISRKLPDTERARLKRILKEVLPESAGVIVRTASEGATEEQLTLDVNRLTAQWAHISEQASKQLAPHLLHSEPDLLIKIVRDVFNEDFHRMVISGDDARATIENYLTAVAPDLLDRVERYEGERDAFDEFRITEQIEKALDRKVWLPSGGSLVIDRTEAMTVVDVNTGKFVGSGGNLEETVTKNNLEAAEEIVRQLRLRDIGGIIVVDFIDMVLESNRDLVLRRLIECLSRDRTKHQVAEVTSLGLVQMTRKKLGLGLLESFSEPCEVCAGRGIIVHHDPVMKHRSGNGGSGSAGSNPGGSGNGRRGRGGNGNGNGSGSSAGNSSSGGQGAASASGSNGTHSITADAKNALAQIAASTIAGAPAQRPQGEPGTEVPAAVSEPSAPDAGAETGAPSGEQAASRSARRRKARQSRAAENAANAGGQSTGETTAEPAAATEAAPVAATEPEVAPERATSAEPQTADDTKASAPTATAEPAATEPAEPVVPVAILDIPVARTQRAPRVNSRDASQLLDSVLDALPEPKQPGQGRSRSRRVSTAAVSAPVETGSSES